MHCYTTAAYRWYSQLLPDSMTIPLPVPLHILSASLYDKSFSNQITPCLTTFLFQNVSLAAAVHVICFETLLYNCQCCGYMKEYFEAVVKFGYFVPVTAKVHFDSQPDGVDISV